jgi:hypothetical protein
VTARRPHMEKWIGLLSFVVSFATLIVVSRQVWNATKATKAQLAVGLIDQLYADKDFQDNFERILADIVTFRITEAEQPVITCKDENGEKDIWLEFNIYLNRFAVLGNLYKLRVLRKRDLLGVRYELLKTGRNKAVRDYFRYLNEPYQKLSRVEHDHFDALKELYLAFEYNEDEKLSFKDCRFYYRADIKKTLSDWPPTWLVPNN